MKEVTSKAYVYMRIILKWIVKKQGAIMWIYLCQYSIQWIVVVNTVMNIQSH
jgi:hypothetical protein